MLYTMYDLIIMKVAILPKTPQDKSFAHFFFKFETLLWLIEPTFTVNGADKS